MIVIRVSVSFCTDAFHFWLVDEVSMLIDGSIATEWCNWICTSFLREKSKESEKLEEEIDDFIAKKCRKMCI